MIAFFSLLTGLLAGVQTVELRAAGEVATVELRLDGEKAATLDGPPWEAEVDFGPELRPHLLEAVARDSEGRELGRAKRYVNYLPSAAGVYLVPGGTSWPPSAFRLEWWSPPRSPPYLHQAWLDGRSLEVSRQGSVLLKPDQRRSLPQAREISARVGFAGGLEAETRLLFRPAETPGADAGGKAPAVTDLAVEVPSPEEVSAKALGGGAVQGFSLPSGPAVAGRRVETGRPVLLVVRDPNLPEALPLAGGARPMRGGPADGKLKVELWSVSIPTSCDQPESCEQSFWISEHDHVELLGRRRKLFQRLPAPTAPDGALHLFAAAAHGGRMAAASGRPRAVLLLLDAETLDGSDFDAAEVGSYLRELRVPFFVWILGLEGELPGLPLFAGGDLEEVLGEAAASLGRQRIVRFEGSFLPREIELRPGSGWRWATSAPRPPSSSPSSGPVSRPP